MAAGVLGLAFISLLIFLGALLVYGFIIHLGMENVTEMFKDPARTFFGGLLGSVLIIGIVGLFVGFVWWTGVYWTYISELDGVASRSKEIVRDYMPYIVIGAYFAGVGIMYFLLFVTKWTRPENYAKLAFTFAPFAMYLIPGFMCAALGIHHAVRCVATKCRACHESYLVSKLNVSYGAINENL